MKSTHPTMVYLVCNVEATKFLKLQFTPQVLSSAVDNREEAEKFQTFESAQDAIYNKRWGAIQKHELYSILSVENNPVVEMLKHPKTEIHFNEYLTTADLLIAFEVARVTLANVGQRRPLLTQMGMSENEANEVYQHLNALMLKVRSTGMPLETPASQEVKKNLHLEETRLWMKTLSETIADARSTHDIRDVLGLRQNERVVVCPLPMHIHKHNTPSFSIFWRRGLQWWRCHGSCDLEGDVVDLVGFLRVPGYDKRDPQKIREAVTLLDDRFQISIPKPEPGVELAGNEYLQYLPPGPEVIAYAMTRGLSEETLKKFKIGENHHYMAIPCFEEGQLRGVKMRNIWKCDPKKRFWQLEGSHLGLFNYDAVAYKHGATFIVKGEIPAMLLDQMGYQVCAPTAGEGNNLERWRVALALSARIVIGDNDGPGIKLGTIRSALFGASLYFPPREYKDIDEFILAKPSEAREFLDYWKNEALSSFE